MKEITANISLSNFFPSRNDLHSVCTKISKPYLPLSIGRLRIDRPCALLINDEAKVSYHQYYTPIYTISTYHTRISTTTICKAAAAMASKAPANTNTTAAAAAQLSACQNRTAKKSAALKKSNGVRKSHHTVHEGRRPGQDAKWLQHFKNFSGTLSTNMDVLVTMLLQCEPDVCQGNGIQSIKNLSQSTNWETALAQAVGQVARSACSHCTKDQGPSSLCVVVPGQLHGSCHSCKEHKIRATN